MRRKCLVEVFLVALFAHLIVLPETPRLSRFVTSSPAQGRSRRAEDQI